MRKVLTVFAIWFAGLGAAGQFAKVSVSYDQIGAAYPGLPVVWSGLLVSIVGLVGLVFGTTAGLLVVRVGARRALLGALVIGALVSLIESVLPAYPVMLFARALEGVSHLTIVVVGPTTIAGVAAGKRQGAAMTLWATIFGLTFAVMAWIAPAILQAGGLALLFQLHAGWMLACAAALAALMPREVRLSPARLKRGLLAQHLTVYSSPVLAAPASAFVCYTVTYVAVLTLLPGALSAGWGHAAGVLLPLVSIAAGLVLGVWLLGRWPAVRVTQAGFLLALLASPALWLLWSSGPGAFAATLVLGAGLGLVPGSSYAAIAQLNPDPEDRAWAAGAIAQTGNLGTTLGTPVLALVMQKAGSAGLSVYLAIFSALGILAVAAQARRRRRA